MVRNRLPLEVHGHQDLVPEPNQPASIAVAVDLRILRPPVINHMLIHKVSLVAIEPVGDEDWNIILPGVAGCGGQQNPVVGLDDFKECLSPGSIPDNPLLVKYKEGVLDVYILGDIVPGVDDHFVFVVVGLRGRGEQERSQVSLPFAGIPLASRGDDVEIPGVLHRNIIVRTQLATLLQIIVSEAGPGFARADPAAEDAPVFHPVQGFALIVIKLDRHRASLVLFLQIDDFSVHHLSSLNSSVNL